MSTRGYWIDAGRPNTYIDANVHYATLESCAVQSNDIDPTATVVDSVVSQGVWVGAGARIEHSVLLTGASVRAGARVSDSIVHGSIGANATLRNVTVAHDGIVADGETIEDRGVPRVEGA
jgi:ADP-glucose pyrophosphorylase